MVRNVIIYSSLFPSKVRPINGLFVAELVRSLASILNVSVITPVLANMSFKEIWKGQRSYYFTDRVEVKAPLCFNFPRILKSTDGYLMATCTRRVFRKCLDENIDLVHAHFAYPDAVAAKILSAEYGLPLIVTVHGSDINVLLKSRSRRYQIIKMLQEASAVVAVADDLVKKIIELGVSEEQIFHIPNGVDITRFRPGDKISARKAIGIDPNRRLLLGVGHLVTVKAFDRLVMAITNLDPDIDLILVGDGRERVALKRLVQSLQLERRVKFAGPVEHNDLPLYYHAADFLVISSHSEGWPTVIFESLACGVPVIANGVGGIPEVLSSPELGMVMNENNPLTIANVITSAYERNWDRQTAVSFAR